MQLNPQDQKILSLLQQNEANEALELAYETYFPSLKEKWLAAYNFFNDEELEYTFGKAFSKLKKNPETDIPLHGHLEKEGLTFLKGNHQFVSSDHEGVVVIRAISENRKEVVDPFYTQNQEAFIGFAAKNYSGCDTDTVRDVYHDAWGVLLRSYIQRNRIRILETSDGETILIGLRNEASLGTFLFGIAKRMLLKKCKSREQYIDPDDFLKPYFELPTSYDDNENSDLVQKLLLCLKKLSENCQEILRCKYWYGMSMEEIKEQIGARSAGAVRTRKKRCMDRLEALVRK